MQSQYTTGAVVHGEFSSADASGLSEPNARILLYGAGSTTAATLDANDYVVITDVFALCGATGLTVTIYDGANNSAGAGEVVVKGTFAANGGLAWNLSAPHVCQKGTWPKVLTSAAGQIDVSIKAYIYRAGA